MSFQTLLGLPMSEAKENQTIHLLMENKEMCIMPTLINLTFFTYYATNDYLYGLNIYISAFTLQLLANFIMLDTDSRKKWKLRKTKN